MEQQYLSINKKDNKLLYLLDSGLDKFVMFILSIVRLISPHRFKEKIDSISEHKDMVHNVVGLAFFNALGGACVMATQVKLANYLGASVYGIYSYCLAIGEVGAMFVRYGRNKTMVRDLIQNPCKRDSLVVSTFFLSLINLILYIGVIFAYHGCLDIEANWTYFLLILSPCLVSLTLDPLYESLKMMSWSSIYALLQKFGFLVVIWFLLLLQYKLSLFAIGAIVVFSWMFILFLQYYEVISQLHINFLKKVKIRELLELYRENFFIFLCCVTGVAFGPLIRLILKNYTDSTTVGIYAAGLQIQLIFFFLNTQIARVGNPMMAEAGKKDCSLEKRRKLVIRYVIIMLLTCIPFTMPMLLCPGVLTSLFFTKEYEALAIYLPIIAIYMMTIAIGIVFEQLLISLRKDKLYFTIYVTTAVLTVVVAYILIPKLGLLGAFLSLCLPHSVGYLVYAIVSVKFLRS